MRKFLLLIVFLSVLVGTPQSQIVKLTGVGGGVGLGVFKGNTPEEFGYSAQASLDFKMWFSDKYYFRGAAFYTRKFSILLPEDRFGKIGRAHV